MIRRSISAPAATFPHLLNYAVTPPRKLRIATINFLNPAPLMWDFEHPPRAAALAARYALRPTTPAECAVEVAAARADIGLIPVAAYATIPDLAIVPGCAIASLHRVRSILLVARRASSTNTEECLKAVRTVAADTSSRSSLAYAQILFRKFLGTDPAFLQHPPSLEQMLQAADAALLIGDPALLALQAREQIEARAGEKYMWLDLAEEWNARTGLPWVAAFWAVRPDALAGSSIAPAQLIDDLRQSRDHGLAHLEDLVAEWQPRIALPSAVVRDYLARNIHYALDERGIAALNLFYRYAEECEALPAAPPLRFLA